MKLNDHDMVINNVLVRINNDKFPVSAGRFGDVSYRTHGSIVPAKKDGVQKTVVGLVALSEAGSVDKHLKYTCDYLQTIYKLPNLLPDNTKQFINPNHFVVRLYGKCEILTFSPEGEFIAKLHPGIIHKAQELYEESKLINVRP